VRMSFEDYRRTINPLVGSITVANAVLK
jgi:hypothetical protein